MIVILQKIKAKLTRKGKETKTGDKTTKELLEEEGKSG